MAMTLSEFGRTEVDGIQGYAIIYRRQIAPSTPEWHKVIIDLSAINSLNRNVRMVACRQWGDSRV